VRREPGKFFYLSFTEPLPARALSIAENAF
jgi:hypothetical protein